MSHVSLLLGSSTFGPGLANRGGIPLDDGVIRKKAHRIALLEVLNGEPCPLSYFVSVVIARSGRVVTNLWAIVAWGNNATWPLSGLRSRQSACPNRPILLPCVRRDVDSFNTLVAPHESDAIRTGPSEKLTASFNHADGELEFFTASFQRSGP